MTEPLPPPQEAIERLLGSMTQFLASDLHLKVGYPPYFRVQGALRAAMMAPLPDTQFIEAMLKNMAPAGRRDEYDKRGALDFAVRGTAGDRFRVNMFRSVGDMHVSIRRVQSEIPSFEVLNLPDIYRSVVKSCNDGLILVSGVSGCGKSTTLAAMVEYINQVRSVHIITIEDPIEYIFTPKKSIISQREIGIDVPNYPEALRHMVRQDPDCIMIGEMRDRDTMLAAIQSAETGHLVLGSLHTGDVQQTFTRMLEFFPRTEHAFIRSSLANSLRTIMCQKLLPGIDEGSLYPATEVLLKNPAVKEKILNEKDEDLPDTVTQFQKEGMRSFTYSLCELIETEKIHYDTGIQYAPNRDALASAVKGIKAS